MKILINGATKTLRELGYPPGFGLLTQPRSRNRIDVLLSSGYVLAGDNGCFGTFNAAAYLRMLDNMVGKQIQWVTCPDVVGSARGTLLLYDHWAHVIAEKELPIAFVAQDGMRVSDIPLAEIACVFIGGSTEWKLGPEAAKIVEAARAEGLEAHMGRVNSYKRIKYAHEIGCTSVDGTCYSMFPDIKIPKAQEWLRRLGAI